MKKAKMSEQKLAARARRPLRIPSGARRFRGMVRLSEWERVKEAMAKQGARPLVERLFATLWDTLYEDRGLGWDVNPWVWAATFHRTKDEAEA